MIDVIGIVTQYLIDNNYDGLCTHDCGCGVDCLMPCGEGNLYCMPAKKRICKECDKNGHCEIKSDFECEFCYHLVTS